jgi:hypothetical protein
MSRQRTVVLAAIVAALLGANSARADGGMSVTVDTTRIQTSLGQKLRLETVVANNGTATSSPLVAHMTIFSLRSGPYVDPEDWSSQRTKYLAALPAGASRAIAWNVQAVNDGQFGVSFEVLPQTGTGAPAIGPAVRLDVAQRDTLDAGGILPLALGVPALLGLLTIAVHVARRRT